ncbi:unnamed protein product [Strongylus vulgaris]|uniref:Uncharacterized protein n=1 Tax=Strongylus vulgaris TaxID=40348 RepID=A0A3P7HVX1_STRVU|nr:unnamed protein product [Strongylus vulgaris]
MDSFQRKVNANVLCVQANAIICRLVHLMVKQHRSQITLLKWLIYVQQRKCYPEGISLTSFLKHEMDTTSTIIVSRMPIRPTAHLFQWHNCISFPKIISLTC